MKTMETEQPKETVEEQIPIFKSRLVPDSRVLKEDEEKVILEKYDISKQQLPRISGNDAVVKKLGAKAGEIIEFKRKNPIAGLSIYYRVVVGGL